jgi:hypothetical protein
MVPETVVVCLGQWYDRLLYGRGGVRHSSGTESASGSTALMLCAFTGRLLRIQNCSHLIRRGHWHWKGRQAIHSGT